MQSVSLWDDPRTQLSTPEQVDLQLAVANVGSRGLALMVDFALRYGVLVLLYFILVLTTQFRAAEMDLGLKGFAVLFFIVFFVTEWFYFALFEGWWNGQTPGKRLLGLRVIREDGAPVSWLEVVLRNLLRPLDTTGPMALVGMTSIFLTSRGQRPGDLVARTLVIRERPVDWAQLLEGESEGGANGAAIRLSPLELEMLQRYLGRSAAMEASHRERVARLLHERLAPHERGTTLERMTLTDDAWLRELAKRV
jgi:uncharacterized RDD family membrane protein YckC